MANRNLLSSNFSWIFLTLITGFSLCNPHLQAQMSRQQQVELATLDAAATAYGSIGNWIRNDPEAAISLLQQHRQVSDYIKAKLEEYAGIDVSQNAVDRNFALRIKDRVKQMEQSLKDWNNTIPRYQTEAPKQIATDLKRQSDAAERFQKSKSPRPSSFAYVPKNVWQTRNKLDILKASGADTGELEKEQQRVQQKVLAILKTLDRKALAKSNGYIRDAYKKEDRSSIEQFVQEQWLKRKTNKLISKIVIPKQSWEHTYSVQHDSKSNKIEPLEEERMTVYVAAKVDEEIVTMYPIRLARLNFKVNGQVLGKTTIGPLRELPTNEFSFDVLAKNIR